MLASNNPGKLCEIQAIFRPLDINIHLQSEYSVPPAIEDGKSFVENAIKKARHASAIAGLPALGDDSGLCVDALGGAPGIYSARYAGQEANDEANMHKLIMAMKDISDSERSAHFYCAIALVRHAEDPEPLLSIGRWQGQILHKPRGNNGFGYDPIFYVPECDCTSAELEADKKNQISHRAQALSVLTELTHKDPGCFAF